MPQTRTEQPATDVQLSSSDRRVTEEDTLTSEMLVEEVSIDGMCGVY
jgi:mycofactocin precursor